MTFNDTDVIPLDELKRHLQIEEDYQEDDTLLRDLLNVAFSFVESELGFKLTEYFPEDEDDIKETDTATDYIPYTVLMAVKMAVASFYNTSRENETSTKLHEVPLCITRLLSPHKEDFIQ